MELGNQPLSDSKHCEAPARATAEAKLCYDFSNFNMHKNKTAATSTAAESNLEPKPRCPGEAVDLELFLGNGQPGEQGQKQRMWKGVSEFWKCHRVGVKKKKSE